MAVQIVINLLVSIIWLLISDSYTLNNFVLGFVFGLLLVYLMRKILPGRFYIITLYYVAKLGCTFLIELIKANIDVIRIVTKPHMDNEPAFFVYDTDLKQPWEVVLLCTMITLTPGTIVLGVSDDNRKIYIHCLDFSTKEEEIEGIKSSLEKAVREVGEY